MVVVVVLVATVPSVAWPVVGPNWCRCLCSPRNSRGSTPQTARMTGEPVVMFGLEGRVGIPATQRRARNLDLHALAAMAVFQIHGRILDPNASAAAAAQQVIEIG